MALTTDERKKVLDYITAYCPALIDNSNLDFFIEDAVDTLSATYFGKHYLKAVAFLTMHNGTIASQTSATGADSSGGVVLRKTIGPVTIQYSDPASQWKGWYSQYGSTRFGIILLNLIKTCGGGSISVNNMWRAL